MRPFGELEVLTLLSDNPRERGVQHGEHLRKAIHAMGAIRMGLMLRETDLSGESEVLALAHTHLPVLKKFDEELYQELMGIAEGARISPELVVVINHYTDMRDIRKPGGSGAGDNGGCSAIFVQTQNGPMLAQTWDVHGSAMEHVFILRTKNELVFSVAGCLGMTGMSRQGVGITINNLSSVDAKVGVVWPALVRKVLRCTTASQGRDVIMNAPLGSGHHYVVADTHDLFAIETSGSKKKITQSSAQVAHIHTNHCLDDEMRLTHTIRKGSTTFERFDGLQKILADDKLGSASDIFEALGSVSIAQNPNDSLATATCGAIVMELSHGKALACKGPPSLKLFHNPPLLVDLKS